MNRRHLQIRSARPCRWRIDAKALLFSVTFLSGTFTASVRAQVVGCVAEGPDLQKTFEYIAGRGKIEGSSVDDIQTDSLHGTLDIYISSRQRFRVRFMQIKCDKTEFGISKGGDVRAYLRCSENVKCVEKQQTADAYSETFRTESDFDVKTYLSITTEDGDPDTTRNLARSLSHLVYLLQLSFRDAHRNNDPFAPK